MNKLTFLFLKRNCKHCNAFANAESGMEDASSQCTAQAHFQCSFKVSSHMICIVESSVWKFIGCEDGRKSSCYDILCLHDLQKA